MHARDCEMTPVSSSPSTPMHTLCTRRSPEHQQCRRTQVHAICPQYIACAQWRGAAGQLVIEHARTHSPYATQYQAQQRSRTHIHAICPRHMACALQRGAADQLVTERARAHSIRDALNTTLNFHVFIVLHTRISSRRYLLFFTR